ncbi:hypothetical protein AM1_C0126 (plasmid) [Acaryochloris marina MBIC11017]|uniref:Uncharacterized protein n=1 Tax=Acaryochloris marina (strain MBIC 11017) TaxID=329726 RepID=A8ZMM2_ACAM1|nr:hypothetical protein AM1_C0126 [Acaryochloris marina MBIC11017]
MFDFIFIYPFTRSKFHYKKMYPNLPFIQLFVVSKYMMES